MDWFYLSVLKLVWPQLALTCDLTSRLITLRSSHWRMWVENCTNNEQLFIYKYILHNPFYRRGCVIRKTVRQKDRRTNRSSAPQSQWLLTTGRGLKNSPDCVIRENNIRFTGIRHGYVHKIDASFSIAAQHNQNKI